MSNSVITTKEKILFKKPSNFSEPIAKLEKGKIADYNQKCENNWCNIIYNEYTGMG